MSPALRRVVAVDDIVQESLARGLASIESFTWRGEGSLLRWLGTIARNVIASPARSSPQRSSPGVFRDGASSVAHLEPSPAARREDDDIVHEADVEEPELTEFLVEFVEKEGPHPENVSTSSSFPANLQKQMTGENINRALS